MLLSSLSLTTLSTKYPTLNSTLQNAQVTLYYSLFILQELDSSGSVHMQEQQDIDIQETRNLQDLADLQNNQGLLGMHDSPVQQDIEAADNQSDRMSQLNLNSPRSQGNMGRSARHNRQYNERSQDNTTVQMPSKKVSPNHLDEAGRKWALVALALGVGSVATLLALL